MKPRLFVASSSEQLGLAYALQESLVHDVETTVWTQGVFTLSRSTMADLMNILSEVDFGLFVLAPDDLTQMRGKELNTVRDNVLFELGMFVGRLGAERSFLVIPSGAEIHLPTDLLGMTPATFESNRQDGNLLAALGPACNRIRRVIQKLGHVVPVPSIILADITAVEQPDTITDPGDIFAILQSWMGSRPNLDNTRVLKFAEVDRELRLELGSAKKYLAKVAQRWDYVIAQQGVETILFRDAPAERNYF